MSSLLEKFEKVWKQADRDLSEILGLNSFMKQLAVDYDNLRQETLANPVYVFDSLKGRFPTILGRKGIRYFRVGNFLVATPVRNLHDAKSLYRLYERHRLSLLEGWK